MDLFNIKKIKALTEFANELSERISKLERDNRMLTSVAFEQFKKSNKPKFNVGDKVTYQHFFRCVSGVVCYVYPKVNEYGNIRYYYEIASGDKVYKYFEVDLTKTKN